MKVSNDQVRKCFCAWVEDTKNAKTSGSECDGRKRSQLSTNTRIDRTGGEGKKFTHVRDD